MKKMLLATILFLILLFSMNVYGGGFNPPSGTEHLSGPAVVGTLILTSSSSDPGTGYIDSIDFTFAGNCKGQPIIMSYQGYGTAYYFGDLLAEHLVDIRIPTEIVVDFLNGCWPKASPQPLIINTVSKFIHSGTQIIAEIVLLYVIPQ